MYSTFANPLRCLPSVLALGDLQRRWRRVSGEMPFGEAELVLLLQLDPLATLRALRAAHTPVFRSRNEPMGIRDAVRRLGPTVIRQLLEATPPVDAPEPDLRNLWRHAVATACAAEELALTGGLMPPDTAYLLGLLHDLPTWLQVMNRTFTPLQATRPPAFWLANWQLPTSLQATLQVLFLTPASDEPPRDAATLVRTAERLADYAGFPHPFASGKPLPAADKTDQVAAQRLRRRVEGALRTFGLDPSIPDHEFERGGAVLPPLHQRHGELDELVLRVLGAGRPDRYLAIATALTAAAVRYANFDRAFLARWNPASGRLTLRSKCDASSRRLTNTPLQPTAAEQTLLVQSQQSGEPTLLTAPAALPTGLLGALSTDELLVVPLPGTLMVPSFLLLDRSVQLAPIEVAADRAKVTTLGLIGSTLHENLLLRRRQQRAQKFAVTDPLTRLSNRRMGLAALEREVARAERNGRPLTVLMCDLDHFKQLNDTFGHQQGDAALQAAANVLRHTVRKTDMVCRYGGEEFLVVLAETSADDATVLAARLFTAMAAQGERIGLPITMSIGLTTWRPGDTAESLLSRADTALYASKGHGRNRFSADVDPVDEPAPTRP